MKNLKTQLMSDLKHISSRNLDDFKKWAGKGIFLVAGRDKEPVGVYLPIKVYERLVERSTAPETVKNHHAMSFCACGSTHGDAHTNGCTGEEFLQNEL